MIAPCIFILIRIWVSDPPSRRRHRGRHNRRSRRWIPMGMMTGYPRPISRVMIVGVAPKMLLVMELVRRWWVVIVQAHARSAVSAAAAAVPDGNVPPPFGRMVVWMVMVRDRLVFYWVKWLQSVMWL